MGRRAKPRKGTPARKSAKNDGLQIRDLERRLAEALEREAEAHEQQTATAEILRVIAGRRQMFSLCSMRSWRVPCACWGRTRAC
jgi:hypothetical protein